MPAKSIEKAAIRFGTFYEEGEINNNQL